jgi:hypothetical protein
MRGEHPRATFCLDFLVKKLIGSLLHREQGEMKKKKKEIGYTQRGGGTWLPPPGSRGMRSQSYPFPRPF